MSGFLELCAGVSALVMFVLAALWLFTPKRAPARRARRGLGALVFLAIACVLLWLAQRASGQ